MSTTQLGGGQRGVCLICRDGAASRSSCEWACMYVFYGNNILVRIKKDTWPEYEWNVQAEMWPGQKAEKVDKQEPQQD